MSFSTTLTAPVLLTEAETKEVAGGLLLLELLAGCPSPPPPPPPNHCPPCNP